MPKSKFKQAGLGKCSEVLLPPTMTADDQPERCCPSKTLAFCPQADNGPGASGLVNGLVTWRPLCCQIGHDMIVFCPPCLPKRSRHGWSVLTRHVKGRQSFAPGLDSNPTFWLFAKVGWVLQLERKKSAANAHFKNPTFDLAPPIANLHIVACDNATKRTGNAIRPVDPTSTANCHRHCPCPVPALRCIHHDGMIS